MSDVKTAFITLFFYMAVYSNLIAEQLRYCEITNGEQIIHDIKIIEEENFKTIKTTGTKRGAQIITSNITFINETGIVKREYTNTLKSFAFVATQEGDRIVISGTERDKKIHKTF